MRDLGRGLFFNWIHLHDAALGHKLTSMTLKQPSIAREAIGDKFVETYRTLLPHAVHNVLMPFTTPLRWFEVKYVSEPQPRSMELWAVLADYKIALGYTFTPTKSDRFTWSLNIADYSSFDTTGHYTETRLAIPVKGDVEVNRVTCAAPDRSSGGTCVEGERNFQMGRDRRCSIANSALGVLMEAMEECPQQQESFLRGLGWDERKMQVASVRNLGSQATQSALGTLGIEY